MKTFVAIIFSVIAFVVGFELSQYPPQREETTSESMEALELWTQSRAYPAADISPDAHYKAFVLAKTQMHEAKTSAADQWRSIGPINFSGRMTSVAVNPLNPNTVYVGAASGGLWRSFTGGLGGDWRRVTTGFPVLGVNAIALNPSDSNTIYIGTGEVYRYFGSTGGIVIRTTRGSYGLGILKTTNGGGSWTKSLDWSYNQQRGVQMIRLNALNPNAVLAATSDGVYKSTNAGGMWSRTLNVVMATDVVINPNDTTQVLAVCGNFKSPGYGVYRSTDAGNSFTIVSGLPNFSGKGMFDVYQTYPNVVFASLADSTTGSGSLWRTTNFGVTWSLVSSEALYGVQGWYSHFVAVHPTDSSKVVRGGVYIFKSINGGTSSTQKSGTYYDMHHYAHHPTNPNILYVVSDGGVFRSTNFGDTYQDANTGLLTSQFYNGFSNSGTDSLMAMGQVQDHFGYKYIGSLSWPSGAVDEVGWTAINQQNDMIQYAGNRGGGSISKSTDRGVVFRTSSTGISGGVSCWNTPFGLSKSNPNVLYFGRSIIFKTTNAAASWTGTNGGAALDGNPSLCLSVAPTNPDTVFVGTVPGTVRPHVFRTTNGGTAWTDVTGTLPNRYYMDLAVDPNNSRIVYAAIGGFDTTRVAKSMNAGQTWTDVTGTLPNVPTTAIAIDPSNSNHVYVGNDLGVYVSTNGGGNWLGFNEGFPEAVILADLVLSPSNRVLRAATHSNGVYERKLLSATTDVAGQIAMPIGFRLEQNYPNPFNPSTTIEFTIPHPLMDEHGSVAVSLTVFDVTGKEIRNLVHGNMQPGSYKRAFDASNLSSGVYFYRLQANGASITKKMILIR
jgi:hypothetical protein